MKKSLQYLAANCSKLLQHAHGKVLPCVNTTVVSQHLVRITTSYGMIAAALRLLLFFSTIVKNGIWNML